MMLAVIIVATLLAAWFAWSQLWSKGLGCAIVVFGTALAWLLVFPPKHSSVQTLLYSVGIVLMLVSMATVLYLYFKRGGHSADQNRVAKVNGTVAGIMVVVMAAGAIVAVGSTTMPVASSYKGEDVVNAAVVGTLDSGQTTTAPQVTTGEANCRAFDAPKGSNNFGPTPNIDLSDVNAVWNHYRENVASDPCVAASWILVRRDGLAANKDEIKQLATAYRSDRQRWQRDLDGYFAATCGVSLADLGDMPYYSFGMIPGATRTDIATPTQQSELQKMGHTLFFAKCGEDKNPIGFYEVGNRPLCNDQPSAAAPFKEMSPTAPPQPIRPPGQGGGPPPSTPSTTPSTSTTTTPSTSTTTTPSTSTTTTTTPSTSTTTTTTSSTSTTTTTTPSTSTTTTTTTSTCPPGHPDCKPQSGGIDPPTSRTPASPPPSSELETSLPPESDPIDPTVTSDAPVPGSSVPSVPSAGGQTGGQTAIPDPGALPGAGDGGSGGGTGSGSGTGGGAETGGGSDADDQSAHTSAAVTDEAEDAAPTSVAIENSAYSSPLSTGPGLLAVIVFVLFGMLIGGAIVLRFVRRPGGGAYKPQHLA